MNIFRKKGRDIFPKQMKKTYGFVGTHRGVGVTMISFNFSVYLSKVWKSKTAYLEISLNHDMDKMENVLKKENIIKTENEKFILENLTVYKNVAIGNIPQILNENYLFFVFDFGNLEAFVINEFLRCYKKIVICNLVEWKLSEIERFLSEMREIKDYEEWEYILNFGIGEVYKNFILDGSIKLKKMPIIKDCFSLEQDVIKLYQSFT